MGRKTIPQEIWIQTKYSNKQKKTLIHKWKIHTCLIPFREIVRLNKTNHDEIWIQTKYSNKQKKTWLADKRSPRSLFHTTTAQQLLQANSTIYIEKKQQKQEVRMLQQKRKHIQRSNPTG